MVSQKIPTSKAIFIEINDKKIAVIEGYKLRSSRKLLEIEEFSSAVPVATIEAGNQHEIELKQVYFIGQNRFDFHTDAAFRLSIVKPDCRVIFEGCQWVNIEETVSLNSPCIETIRVVSAKRSVQLS